MAKHNPAAALSGQRYPCYSSPRQMEFDAFPTPHPRAAATVLADAGGCGANSAWRSPPAPGPSAHAGAGTPAAVPAAPPRRHRSHAAGAGGLGGFGGAARPQAVPPRLLLAYLLSHASSVGSAAAERVASDLFARFGSLASVIAAPPNSLREAAGIEDDAIEFLRGLHLAVAATLLEPLGGKPLLANRTDLFRYLRFALARERVALVLALFLDRANRLVAQDHVARGTAEACALQPGHVLRRAVDSDAAKVVLVFFRPGPEAHTDEDVVEQANRVAELLVEVGISLLDVLAAADEGALKSLRDYNLLPRAGVDHSR